MELAVRRGIILCARRSQKVMRALLLVMRRNNDPELREGLSAA